MSKFEEAMSAIRDQEWCTKQSALELTLVENDEEFDKAVDKFNDELSELCETLEHYVSDYMKLKAKYEKLKKCCTDVIES